MQHNNLQWPFAPKNVARLKTNWLITTTCKLQALGKDLPAW